MSQLRGLYPINYCHPTTVSLLCISHGQGKGSQSCTIHLVRKNYLASSWEGKRVPAPPYQTNGEESKRITCEVQRRLYGEEDEYITLQHDSFRGSGLALLPQCLFQEGEKENWGNG